MGVSHESSGDPTHAPSGAGGTVAIVAMAKDEDAFIHEWLAYHRIMGVSHFYLYDNDSRTPLRDVVKSHADYVTVIDWPGRHADIAGREPRGGTTHLRNNQTKAYEDSLRYVREPWVAFLDVDEFIVLRHHAALPEFLASFPVAGAIRLTWHYFGHDGHFDTPEGLVISTHLRRRAAPARMHKSINLTRAILTVPNAHDCVLARPHDRAVDANGRPYSPDPYPGKTAAAHINHYVYRSFRDFMARVERGEAAFTKADAPPHQRWRFEPEGRLRKFVEDAKDMNELVDDYMLRFAEPVRAYLGALKPA